MLELTTFKALLGLSEDTQDTKLQFLLDDVTEVILNFCNIDEIPERLEYTAYRMAIDLYVNENPDKAKDGSTLGDITSVQVGDVTISGGGDVGGSRTAFVNSLLKKYETTLRRFRKVRWDR